jgi:hypothetical protein
MQPLNYVFSPDKTKIILLAPFTAQARGHLITVPAGFPSDGLTIPKPLRWAIDPFGKYLRAGIVHDYLYTQAILSKGECDKTFRALLKQLDCPFCQRRAMYRAVRDFGAQHYARRPKP